MTTSFLQHLRKIGITLFYLSFFLYVVRDLPVVLQVRCAIADIVYSGGSARLPNCPQDPPTSAYQKLSISGFTVLVHPQYQNQGDLSEASQVLQQSLSKLVELIPPKHISVLQKVVIWLEPSLTTTSSTSNPYLVGNSRGFYYHYPATTLIRMGLNPDKSGGIGIFDLASFIQNSPEQRLRIILHELAHAYQYQQLGTNYSPIDDAYRQAVANQFYKAVEHDDGYVGEAYALQSQFEYFAELTVAYFATGEYYPFTRSDLAKHDLVGYRLMQEVWK